MYLLNHAKIVAALKDRNSGLQIGGYSQECLQHTFYYFRLGGAVERFDKGSQEWTAAPRLRRGRTLTIDPHDCVRVQSLEHFSLGERVLGVLGGNSDLALRGVTLLHSPFVDPLYPQLAEQHEDDDAPPLSAPLDLALVNNMAVSVTLSAGDRIGKIAFFEISDTYPVQLSDAPLAAQKFMERGRRDEP